MVGMTLKKKFLLFFFILVIVRQAFKKRVLKRRAGECHRQRLYNDNIYYSGIVARVLHT